MAPLPGNQNKPAATVPPKADEPKAEPTTGKDFTNLAFDSVDAMPGAQQVDALTNPFQDETNRLVKEGGASSTVVDDQDAEWARALMRRAAANVNKGSRTKVLPATTGGASGTGEKIPGRTRVFFALAEKTERKSNKSKGK